ncbi:MAG: hypothetical protein U0610_19810 [bacterium]
MTLSAAWEPPDVGGFGHLVIGGALGLVTGLVYARLARGVHRHRQAFACAFWLLAYVASHALFPSAGAVGGERFGPVRRIVEYATGETGPRVLAHLASAYGLFPRATVATTLALALTILVLPRRASWATRFTSLAVVLPALGVATFYGFKLGPPASTCAAPLVASGLRRVVSTESLRAATGLATGRPYDVQVVGEDLVVSVKADARSYGALVLVDRETGIVEDVLELAEAFAPLPAPPLFPERMAVRHDEVLALVLGSADAVLDVVVEGGRFGAPTVIPLGGEPNAIRADPTSDRVWVLLSAATEKGILELRGPSPAVARRSTDPALDVPFQYLDVSADGRTLYSTSTAAPGLRVVDTEMLVASAASYGSALIGVRLDEGEHAAFVADPLRRRLVRIDTATLAPVAYVTLEASGLADVDLDPGAGVVAVGSYTGTLALYSLADLAPVASARLGWLLRNVVADRVRHEVLAASGCGVFVWDLAAVPGVVPSP